MQGLWISHPGEWETFYNAKVSLRRQERGMTYPPIWRLDGWALNACFTHSWTSYADEIVNIEFDGDGWVQLDGATAKEPPHRLFISAGPHNIKIIVGHISSPPALRITGEYLYTGHSWKSSLQDAPPTPCAVWTMGPLSGKPSTFRLPLVPRDIDETEPVQGKPVDNGVLVDFGRESFGLLSFRAKRPGRAIIYYGESLDEVMDDRWCEVFDEVNIAAHGMVHAPETRAMRYVRVAGPVEAHDFHLQEEAPSAPWRASLSSGDQTVTRIWDVSKRTLELCTREFYLDGIKRDRWVWSGDAAQCVMMTPYTTLDPGINRRTLRAVRGKDPFMHLNTILDYTFYWILAVREEYWQTGDASFGREVMPLMRSAMRACLDSRDARGFILAKPGDWVYIDWADMPTDGILCAEQMLFLASLRAMAEMERVSGDPRNAQDLTRTADALLISILKVFYDEKAGVLRHHERDGRVMPLVTRYAAIFAIIYNLLDEKRLTRLVHTTLLSENLLPITTPYMRFYELDALCRVGQHERALAIIKDYWGAMLDLGATSFWEQYIPTESFPAHLAMYGRPYGRSLCHAWGASPVYLLPRHFAGVRPTKPGYITYDVEPKLSGLPSLTTTLPIPGGDLTVDARPGHIAVASSGSGTGRLVVRASGTLSISGGYADRSPDGAWQVIIPPGRRVEATWHL